MKNDTRRSRKNFSSSGPRLQKQRPVDLEINDLYKIMDNTKPGAFSTEYESQLKKDAIQQLITYK